MLEWIEPARLHEAWEDVRTGLLEVQKAGDDWLVEDVYKSIKDGFSQLHIGYLDDIYKGFIITQQIPGYKGLKLHIWAAYSTGKKEEDLLHLALPQIEAWANNIHAYKITFSSNRKGWAKNTLGFVPTVTIFEKEV